MISIRFLHPVLLLLGLVISSQAEESQTWHSTYDQALTEAKESGKPILLTFR